MGCFLLPRVLKQIAGKEFWRSRQSTDKPFLAFSRARPTRFFGFDRFRIEVFYCPSTRLRCRKRMNIPEFQHKLVWLAGTALLALTVTLRAEPPETLSKKSATLRTKPQVIYHLPPSSNYAATLHSQAKGQGNELPVDSSMPTSLQMSRANANAAAAQAQQEAATPPPQDRSVKPPRLQSNRSQTRRHSSPKTISRGNSHGNKSHKK
jgi:hypothetical protein